MMNVPASLYDERRWHFEDMKSAVDRQDWAAYEKAYKRVNDIDSVIQSYGALPNASLEQTVTLNTGEPEPWVMPRMDWDMVAESHIKAIEVTPLGSDNPQFMYVDNYDRRSGGYTSPKITNIDPHFGNTVHYNEVREAQDLVLKAALDGQKKQQNEADLYFEVTGRKKYHESGMKDAHLYWRKEYEETGQSFAFDRMMETFDPNTKYEVVQDKEPFPLMGFAFPVFFGLALVVSLVLLLVLPAFATSFNP